jgi:hypothetical protein
MQTSDGAMFFFMTDELHFGPEFMGRVRLLSSIAGLFGVWLYNAYLKTVKIKDILFWSSIAAFPLGMSNLLLITHANRSLGIPDGAFVFGDDVVLSILGQISFMPTLVSSPTVLQPSLRPSSEEPSKILSLMPSLTPSSKPTDSSGTGSTIVSAGD